MRGAHAQTAARVARERILADDNVDKPPELKTAVTSRNFTECYNLQKYEISKTFCVEVLVARIT